MLTTSQRVAVETSFTYDWETDRYICNDGTVYTSKQVEALDAMQKEYERTRLHLTFTQWVEVFNDEKPAIAKALNAQIKRINLIIDNLDILLEQRRATIQREYTKNPSPVFFVKSKERVAMIETLIAERKNEWKKERAIVQSHHDYVIGKEPPKGRVTDYDISRAREYPIASLIKVGRDHKALCPFHSDTKPSLHVYKDNHAYCFVCTKRASSIDIYMALHSCDFKAALQALAV